MAFDQGLPRPDEHVLLICALTYGDAREAYIRLMATVGRTIKIAGGFKYICLPEQLRGCERSRMWLVDNFSRLRDAWIIEQEAKRLNIELINYTR